MEQQESSFYNNTCWVSYINPFTLIVPDNETPLKVDITEINSNSYNHGKLCRIVKSYKIDHLPDLSILICYDGAIALSRTSIYSNREDAVNFYNEFFCSLLIGGFFCEAIDTRDVVSGRLYEKWAIFPVDFGSSASSHLHSKLRMRMGGSIDSITLSNPEHVYLKDFIQYIEIGKNVLNSIPNITSTFLIRGITELKYSNWSTALSNLWISVEQLTEYLWNKAFLGANNFEVSKLSNRKKSMKDDNRTWSTSVKQEMLYQVGLIGEAEYSNIYPARQARNNLVHEGKNVTKEVAINLFTGVVDLLRICSKNQELPIKRLELENKYNAKKSIFNFDSLSFNEWQELQKDL